MTAQSLVRASYTILCEVLGHPQHRPASGERVLWALDVGGTRAAMREQVKAKPSVDLFDAPDALWLVTADDDAKVALVCKDVSRRVIDAASKRAGGRALRAEDKAKLNELVRQGVSIGDAMKRVRTEIVDDAARALYAWPVVETPPPGAAQKPERARAPASADANGGEGGDEGGEDDEGGEEIDSGDDEGGGDVTGDVSGDDDDRPAPPAPKAARSARDKPGADDMGGGLSGLARLLGALTPKPAHSAAATTATPPAAKTPAAKQPAAKTPAAKTPAAKTPAAKTTATKTTAAKTPAAKKSAAKPVAKTSAKKPTAKPAAKKPDAKKKSSAKKR